MATIKNAFVSIGGTDLSTHIQSVEITNSRETVDDTGMSDNTRLVEAGLRTAGISMEFKQDFSAVDAVLWPLYENGSDVVIIVRPDAGAVSASNPQFTQTCVITDYSPFSGSVGDKQLSPVTFSPRGDLVRSTS